MKSFLRLPHFLAYTLYKTSNKVNAQRPKPAGYYSILFHISRILVPLLIPLVSSTRAIHLIKASTGKDHFLFFFSFFFPFTVYTTHSVVQLCTDCGNLSPSVSERSSLLFGARFARFARECASTRVRHAVRNVRVYIHLLTCITGACTPHIQTRAPHGQGGLHYFLQ